MNDKEKLNKLINNKDYLNDPMLDDKLKAVLIALDNWVKFAANHGQKEAYNETYIIDCLYQVSNRANMYISNNIEHGFFNRNKKQSITKANLYDKYFNQGIKKNKEGEL